jgi:hypothetical protein
MFSYCPRYPSLCAQISIVLLDIYFLHACFHTAMAHIRAQISIVLFNVYFLHACVHTAIPTYLFPGSKGPS